MNAKIILIIDQKEKEPQRRRQLNLHQGKTQLKENLLRRKRPNQRKPMLIKQKLKNL